MFLVLQFVIVIVTGLASIAPSVVVNADPDLHTFPQEGHYKLNDKWLSQRQHRYDIYDGKIQVNTTDIDVTGDLQTYVYAYIESTTVEFSSLVKDKQVSNVTQEDAKIWKFLWNHNGSVAVIASASQSDGVYKVDDTECQVIVMTANEQWVFKNDSYEVTDLPSEWSLVSNDIKEAVRNLGFTCLRERICAKVNASLQHTSPNTNQENTSIILTEKVNDAVDRSLIDIRKDMKNLHETIRIPDANITFNVEFLNVTGVITLTGGTFTNLSTIERTGDAIATIQPGQYSITSTYTFPGATVHYDHYNAQIGTLHEHGETFISVVDLQIQGNRTFNTKDCLASSEQINVTTIGELRYNFRNFRMSKSAPNVKEQIESALVHVLKNTLDYGDIVFGPCTTDTSKMKFEISTS